MELIGASVAAARLMARLDAGGGSFAQLLPDAQQGLPEAERPRLQALCYGLARFGPQLQALLAPLLDKPLRKKDADVYWLMQLGVFQLRHTHMPPHAAVDSVVRAAVGLKKPWAKALVNAVLRRYQRDETRLWQSLDAAARAAHPLWWYEVLRQDWPDDLEALLAANNRPGPMSLRVNLARTTRADYQRQLEAVGLSSRAHPVVSAALILETPVAVTRLPGFTRGLVSVQDPAAQLAIDCLRTLTPPGGRLLDACAAPGGKTAHALETGHWREVVALDIDPMRLQRVRDTLQRVGVQAQVESADAADTDAWWNTQPFDAILLDAPCSGSGVIRRHPDIKQLRRASDLAGLADHQRRLLDRLWPLLKPGGLLLYATCSVLKQENEQQVQAFTGATGNAETRPLPLGARSSGALRPPGEAESAGPRASDSPVPTPPVPSRSDSTPAHWGRARPSNTCQILTGEHDMDGFFMAALAKSRGECA